MHLLVSLLCLISQYTVMDYLKNCTRGYTPTSVSCCGLNYNHLSYHICFSPLVSGSKAYVNSKVFYSTWTICRLFIFRIWCCTSSAELSRVRTQTLPSTSCPYFYTGYTQKNGAVSKVNKKFISHLTRAQRTPSAAATVQVSHALITVLQCVHPGSHDTHPHGNQIHPRLGVACPL